MTWPARRPAPLPEARPSTPKQPPPPPRPPRRSPEPTDPDGPGALPERGDSAMIETDSTPDGPRIATTPRRSRQLTPRGSRMFVALRGVRCKPDRPKPD